MWCVLIIENKVELAPSPFLYYLYDIFQSEERLVTRVDALCMYIQNLAKDSICEHIATVYVFYLGWELYVNKMP